jgi:thioester reductase-like protein/acyl-CoA synthetase (AMP-forming)/AMP-acid ligase II/aryl carrier-like protein
MATQQHPLPAALDEIAAADPHRTIYSVQKTKNITDGFLDISAGTLARAVDRCAWYIEANIGKAGPGFPTLAYMGPQDVVYAVLILACIKTGYKLLLTSPRNTLEAHLSLFERTDCHTMLMPPKFPLPVVQQILGAKEMKVLEIPGYNYWIEERAGEEAASYPYNKSYTEAKLEPFVVLHTSGSTGLPKPIVQSHATVAPFAAFAKLHSEGKQPTYPAMCAGERVYLAFPLFHCAGLSMLLPGPIYGSFTVVLGPFPPSAETVNAIHVHGNVQQSCLAPMTLIELAKDASHLENLRHLKQITFGGGPCPKAVGDLISTKTRLLNCIGTTECSVLPVQSCDPEDWAYISINPVLGHEYRHFSEDLYEMVIVRKPELEGYQAVFGTFPDLQEFPMGDLYSKHPSKDNAWLYKGRADDILVFSTGEKINPIDMESAISAHPSVSAALVTGFGRVQSSLLVEAVKPPTSAVEKKELIDSIWPSIQEANKKSPSHGRIHRHMILFTAPDKPMCRAGKGTVQRKLTTDLYQKEIDALYENSGQGANNTVEGALPSAPKGLAEMVKHVVATCMDIDVAKVDSKADLFGLGLDSLQILLITREINNALSSHGHPQFMETRFVYANPSIGSLIDLVLALSKGDHSGQSGAGTEERLQQMFDTYARNMPLSARQPERCSSKAVTVLLTGSTGSVGSYILESLLRDTGVAKVYCLNRGPDSSKRQQESRRAKGLQLPLDKVEFLDANFSESYFGLKTAAYRDLLGSVNTVIHNAWHVDFNRTIDSFAGQLRTVRDLVDFSSHSRYGAKIFFVSSVSTVTNWHRVTGDSSVPESIHTDWQIVESTGYGQSKFIAERLLDLAAKEAAIPATICRVGQVAGPTTDAGIWPKNEWLPSLIASSKYLRKLPADLGFMDMVDWVPVDLLGDGIVELVLGTSSANEQASGVGAAIYHAVNPQRTPWKTLVPTIARYLDAENGIEVVPFVDWVDELRKSVRETKNVAQNPAIRILDFYETVAERVDEKVVLQTEKSCRASPTLANLGAVDEKLVANWMQQWSF